MEGKFNVVLDALNKYSPKTPEYIRDEISLLDIAEIFYDGREIIINAFKDKIFPCYKESHFEDKDKDIDEIRDENAIINFEKLNRKIYLKERDMRDESIRKHSIKNNTEKKIQAKLS